MELFTKPLTMRFLTLEKNIKTKSNSFYDSYLDLLEATLKYFLDECNVEYDTTRTCGFLLKNDEKVKGFLKSTLGLDDYTSSKLPDYVKKCNEHKHENEKFVSLEAVINYLKVYFDFINTYIVYVGGNKVLFDVDYFNSIYGLAEKENRELTNEVNRLKDDLESLWMENKLSSADNEIYKSIVEAQKADNISLEEQNIELKDQLNKLKDIKINAIEHKLNKAIDLLYNLTDSVVENRALSIAVGATIIGKDITQTEYMKYAIDTLKEKKNISKELLEKLEKESIEVSDNIDDKVDKLYENGERYIREGNFENALKCFRDISLYKSGEWRSTMFGGLMSKCVKMFPSLDDNNYNAHYKFNIPYFKSSIIQSVGLIIQHENYEQINNDATLLIDIVKRVFNHSIEYHKKCVEEKDKVQLDSYKFRYFDILKDAIEQSYVALQSLAKSKYVYSSLSNDIDLCFSAYKKEIEYYENKKEEAIAEFKRLLHIN